jgi:hypothetical protein
MFFYHPFGCKQFIVDGEIQYALLILKRGSKSQALKL